VALAHLSTVLTPPAPAAQNLGVGLQFPCRGKAYGGMLGAMTRIVLARLPTPRCFFKIKKELMGGRDARTITHQITGFSV
jgi:hypothetical protein